MSARRFVAALEPVLSTLVLACLLAGLGLVALGPRLWGLGFLTIYGGSMEPAIPVGALAIARHVPAEAVRAGDVIAFRSEGQRLVTHRVVEVSAGAVGLQFRTQGDANDAPDSELVPAANVVGVVVGYIPILGYVAHYARTPLGAGLISLGLLLFLLLLFRQEIGSALRRQPARGRDVSAEATKGGRFRIGLLLLAVALGAAGLERAGAATGYFSSSKRVPVRISAATWAVPTTLEAEATATAFIAGLLPAAEPGAPAEALQATGPGLGVRGRVVLRNTGGATTQDLMVAVRVQARPDGGEFQDVAGAAQTPALEPLIPGAAIEVPYEILFQPASGGAEYRVLAQATITNHAGHMGQPFGPQAAVAFTLVEDTPTAVPTPATPTPAITLTATATATVVPPETPTATATPTETAAPEATVTPAPTETPTPTSTPEATATPAPTETPTLTSTSEATLTPAPTETPTLTSTPEATATASPTETPTLP